MSVPKENLLWGTYSWILLHWVTYNIRSEYFDTEKEILFGFIKELFDNLPCPNCRNHAQTYLMNVPLKNIETKENLVSYIYNFHNIVNLRGRKKYEAFSIMDKYAHVNVNNMLAAWNIHFNYGNDIQRKDFMAKQRLQTFKNRFITYIKRNINKFRLG